MDSLTSWDTVHNRLLQLDQTPLFISMAVYTGWGEMVVRGGEMGPCSQIYFVSTIWFLTQTDGTFICKWSDWICCSQTTSLWTDRSACYCGNDVVPKYVCLWAVLQCRSMTIGKKEIHHLAIQTLALSSRGAELQTRQTRLWNRLMNHTMIRAAVMALFTVQQEV